MPEQNQTEKPKRKIKAAAALKEFFGYKEGQTMQQFMAELRQLSPAEKQELAEQAARELGLELEA